MRIAVVAPSNTVSPAIVPHVLAIAGQRFGASVMIDFHPQCFLSAGHFAGTDAQREAALVEVANDSTVDAIWLGRGGYGANRIAQRAIARMGAAAHDKPVMGYSDGGFLLGGLLATGTGRPLHGPMPSDVLRAGGGAAVVRALDGLVAAVSRNSPAAPAVAFNLTVLSHLLGTPLQPDLTDRILMLEEVDEPLYRIDRALFHVTSDAGVRRCAGIMLGRCAPVTPNLPDFGMDAVAIARHWCAEAEIAWLGRADIGHDIDNAVVPFG